MSTQTNAIAIRTGFEHLFNGIDFSKLNSSIESLASNDTSNFSDVQRETGIKLIKEWENGVITKLQTYKVDMDAFMDFFKKDSYFESEAVDHQMREAMAAKIGLVKEYKDYIAAYEVWDEERKNIIEKPFIDEAVDSLLVAETKKSEHQVAIRKHDALVARLKNNVIKAHKALVAGFNESDDVKKMLVDCRAYMRKHKSYIEECKSKSLMARTNIMVSDETVRAALKDLLQFSIEL